MKGRRKDILGRGKNVAKKTQFEEIKKETLFLFCGIFHFSRIINQRNALVLEFPAASDREVYKNWLCGLWSPP